MNSRRETLNVEAGSIFTISRPANFTTGYNWKINLKPQLKLMESRYEPQNQHSGQVGVEGLQFWTLQANIPGKFRIELIYSRSWEHKNMNSANSYHDGSIIENIDVEVRNNINRSSPPRSLYLPPLVPDFSNKRPSDNRFFINLGLLDNKITIHRDRSKNALKIRLPFSLPYSEDLLLDFYWWNNSLHYILKKGHGFDMIYCLYNDKGEKVSCPEGGLTGHGDGSVFDNYINMGTISIPQGRTL